MKRIPFRLKVKDMKEESRKGKNKNKKDLIYHMHKCL
jgi:hypothetical protein